MAIVDLLRELPAKADRSLFKVERWVTPEEGEILAGFVKHNGIMQVLESGTANGYSALWMASEGVRVDTWDIANRPKLWDSYPELATLSHDGIAFHNDAYAYGIWKWIQPEAVPHLFFIDGDHEEPWVRKDWEYTKRYAAPGDLIVLHDAKACVAVADLARETGAEILDTRRGFAVFRA